MKEVPQGLKSWVELVEKSLLVAALIAGLLVSIYKGHEFMSNKSEQLSAKNNAFKAVVSSHENLIRTLDAQISGLDAELSNLSIDNALWKSKEQVRKMKALDRRFGSFEF